MTSRTPTTIVRVAVTTACALVLALPAALPARAQAPGAEPSFDQASSGIHQRLEAALVELSALREQMKQDKLPLSRRLSELEQQLAEVRKQYQAASRRLDSRNLEVANLNAEIKARQGEATYLSNLLDEYIRNLEAGLHIAELQRYERPLEDAKLAMENSTLSPQDRYTAQVALVDASLTRLEDALGGTRFDGTAVDDSGRVQNGSFVLIGPVAYFRSADGEDVGTVEQRLGSLEPSIVAFNDPLDAQAVAALVQGPGKTMPLDTTLGNAAIMEMTQDSFLEHVKKGGPVMIPIFGLAAAALLVALYKWLAIVLTRQPSGKRLRLLLAAVAARDLDKAGEAVRAIKGPAGKMLQAGVDHLGEPRELIEEVMYERVLTTRLKVQRLLPFIAICAAAAPLLGLLGTVTGIINTFKLITVFGTGDVKTLSGGISEALITTKFGLIVAIPALLIHAFLARKARGVIDQMEKAAVSFINQVLKTPMTQAGAAAAGALSGPVAEASPAAAEPAAVTARRPRAFSPGVGTPPAKSTPKHVTAGTPGACPEPCTDNGEQSEPNHKPQA